MKTKLAAAGAEPPPGSVQSVKLPAGEDGSANAFSTEHPLESAPVSGTIGTTVDSDDSGSYRTDSESLVRSTPVQVPEDPSRLKLHAKDLIEELDAINAQIQRIMFLVEKAVARLATSG